MYCSNCGAKLHDNIKFCPYCGTPLGHSEIRQDEASHFVVCKKCGYRYDSRRLSCPQCEFPKTMLVKNQESLGTRKHEDGLKKEVVSSIKPIIPIAIVVLVVAILVYALSPKAVKNTHNIHDDSSETDEIIKAEDLNFQTEKTKSIISWHQDMLKVGVDIPAGTYVLAYPGEFYWEISSDSSGTLDSILANGNTENREYVYISNSQYLSTDATVYDVDDAPIVFPKNGRLPAGTYKVGKDIDPGEYLISATSSNGYVEILSSPLHTLESIYSNDNFSGSKYVTVKSNQYLHLSNAELVLR